MYSGAAIILAPLGETVVSGHAVALNIASIVFMLPLAIGLAASTRVGNLLGEKRYIDARYSSKISLSLCFIGALLNMTLLITLGDKLISLYTMDLLVYSVASHLIIFAAIFQIPDGIGMGSLGALRGYKDTFMTMVFIIIAYWVFAIPFGYYLTYYGINQPMGESGMWNTARASKFAAVLVHVPFWGTPDACRHPSSPKEARQAHVSILKNLVPATPAYQGRCRYNGAAEHVWQICSATSLSA